MNGSNEPAPGPSDIGRLVDGRYRLEDVIGVGGMATVHRARDGETGRRVAIKLLRREVLADQDLAMRFRREALAATVLRHPNIIACLEAGTDDGQPYLVMELVDGEDLAARIRRDGQQPIVESIRIGIDVARALGVAHLRGIIHRDVKPGNIVLARNGRAMITDFGIARLAADAEGAVPGTTLGSVHYFSPEQATGQSTTPASDVYGLGLVLYEALTGRRAWSGATSAEIAAVRIGSPAPSPGAVRADVPAALDTIVRRALAPDPVARYENGSAMAAALEPLLASIARPVPLVCPVTNPTATITPAPALTPTPAGTRSVITSRPTTRRPRAPAAVTGPLAILGIVVAVVAGALLIAALPGPDGSVVARGSAAATGRAPTSDRPAADPSTQVALTTAAPQGSPTATPLRSPRPPTGKLADLCQPFFGFACGIGPGKVEPTVFQPTVRFTLEDGWSVADLDRRLLTLVRDEGSLSLASSIDAVYPAGDERPAPRTAHSLVETFIGTDQIAAEPPRTRQVGDSPAVVVDLTPIGRRRVDLFRIGDRVVSLEPGSPTRIIAVDSPTGLMVIAIGSGHDSSLQAILPAAKAVIKTIRFR